MDLPILEVFRRVGRRTEADIAFLISPHSQWLEVGPHYPLPYIEFFLSDYERPFDILLHHPGCFVANNIGEYFFQIIECFDTSSSGHACWFYYPYVVAV